MSELCVFCDEFEQGENTFAETELWRARWDKYPATPGHVEVTPKRHVQYFEQLTDDERRDEGEGPPREGLEAGEEVRIQVRRVG
jgi:diadenosine tetraphosphate (Ap4A) HIT family hydrolase